jgi:serine/threonine protein phosphatase 1
MSKYKKFEQNATGKDFICGDIHGCWDKLEWALDAVGFDKTKDRLFCLGDMIDRGPKSEDFIRYIRKPWFYSIMGNHEALLCGTILSETEELRKSHYRAWFINGGWWMDDVAKEDLEDYADLLRKLPLAIELEIGDGRSIGLVHAEVMNKDWNEVVENTNTTPEDAYYFQEEGTIGKCERYLWGRDKIYLATNPFNKDVANEDWTVQNIEAVFHGHTIFKDIFSIANCHHIDTGSYEPDGFITVIQPKEFLDSLK